LRHVQRGKMASALQPDLTIEEGQSWKLISWASVWGAERENNHAYRGRPEGASALSVGRWRSWVRRAALGNKGTTGFWKKDQGCTFRKTES